MAVNTEKQHLISTGLQYANLDIVLMLHAKFGQTPTRHLGEEGQTNYGLYKCAKGRKSEKKTHPNGTGLQHAQQDIILRCHAKFGEKITNKVFWR